MPPLGMIGRSQCNVVGGKEQESESKDGLTTQRSPDEEKSAKKSKAGKQPEKKDKGRRESPRGKHSMWKQAMM